MRASYYNIACVALTKSMFKELILEDSNSSYNTMLVSPLGNLFQLGDIDEIEEIEVDKHHTEFIMEDAGQAKRKILFHGEISNYSILISEEGTPNVTTGVAVDAKNTNESWDEFVQNETGMVGQEVHDHDGDYDDEDGDTLEEFMKHDADEEDD